MAFLVINCGSSSVKFALFGSGSSEPLAQGLAERLGSAGASAKLRKKGEDAKAIAVPKGADHAAALSAVLGELSDHRIAAVGHRVVHGGPDFCEPVVVTDEILQRIRDLAPLAPLHAIPNALGIEAVKAVFADIPHVAVFDTAFHQSIEPCVYRYALPAKYYETYRIRRYGFHGTSHAWVATEAAKVLGLPADKHRLITAHLGYGCSATAVVDGCSVDTSMGFTPLEGLVMGTRSGSLDPNLHAYLVDEAGLSLEDITRLLNHESGLLGLSGLSGDMRELTAAHHEGNAEATLALRVFVFRLAREIGGLIVSLGGRPDGLVFTGGIGENSFLVREWTVARLKHLGFGLDPALNEQSKEGVISPPDSESAVLIVPTNEELAIATATKELTASA
ncbi:MAG: acetate kinase [Verrucomicrobiota bacterium JB023]|nr:acetate kinase [Verrucomicrobiota bacterium JB023]